MQTYKKGKSSKYTPPSISKDAQCFEDGKEERFVRSIRNKELEKKIHPYLKDDFIGSEAEFWKLLHRLKGLSKEEEIEKLRKYLKISRKEAEKLLEPFF